jgi:hypothetical protein
MTGLDPVIMRGTASGWLAQGWPVQGYLPHQALLAMISSAMLRGTGS